MTVTVTSGSSDSLGLQYLVRLFGEPGRDDTARGPAADDNVVRCHAVVASLDSPVGTSSESETLVRIHT